MGKVVKFKPGLEYFIKISDARLAAGDYLGAISAIRSGIHSLKQTKKRDSLYVILGQLYFGIDLYELSNYYLFKAYYIDELRACVCFCLGRNMVRLKRFDVADLYFYKCIELDTACQFTEFVKEWIKEANDLAPKAQLLPAETRLLAKAKSELAGKNYSAALNTLNALPQEHAFLEDALYTTAAAHYLAGDLLSAREEAKKLLRFNPESVYGYCILVNICRDEHDFESLEINTQVLLGLTPQTQNELYRTALTLIRAEKFKESMPYFEKLLFHEEYNIKILFFHSLACYLNHDYEDALYHISRAKWIDYDNKILDFYYNFYRQKITLNLEDLTFQIPKDLSQKKVRDLQNLLNSTSLSEQFVKKSHFLLDDIEWTFTLKSPAVTRFIAEKLIKANTKPTNTLLHNAMLNNFNSDRQKFEVLKQHYYHSARNIIDFVADYKYRSMKLVLPAGISQTSVYKLAYIDAECFAEVYAAGCSLKAEHERILPKLSKAINLDINQSTLTCVLFSHSPAILKQACAFFGSTEEKVNDLKKLLEMY